MNNDLGHHENDGGMVNNDLGHQENAITSKPNPTIVEKTKKNCK